MSQKVHVINIKVYLNVGSFYSLTDSAWILGLFSWTLHICRNWRQRLSVFLYLFFTRCRFYSVSRSPIKYNSSSCPTNCLSKTRSSPPLPPFNTQPFQLYPSITVVPIGAPKAWVSEWPQRKVNCSPPSLLPSLTPSPVTCCGRHTSAALQIVKWAAAAPVCRGSVVACDQGGFMSRPSLLISSTVDEAYFRP